MTIIQNYQNPVSLLNINTNKMRKNYFPGQTSTLQSVKKKNLGSITKVNSWRQEHEVFSLIDDLQSPAAYSAYINGFKQNIIFLGIEYTQRVQDVKPLRFVIVFTCR